MPAVSILVRRRRSRALPEGWPLSLSLCLGGGCSCIHALLAVRLNPQWKMLVSEIDPVNYRTARKNVEQNGLADRIRGRTNRSFLPVVLTLVNNL